MSVAQAVLVTPVFLDHLMAATLTTIHLGSVCQAATLHTVVTVTCQQQVACTLVCIQDMGIINKRHSFM